MIDVGAHHGGFAESLRAGLGFSGYITSFEPTSSSFAVLATKAGLDPRWEVHKVALGAQAGTAQLRLYDASELNSISPFSADADEYLGSNPGVTGFEKTAVARLEDAWPSHPSTSRYLLKTDAQAHDLDVVRGTGTRTGDLLGVLMEVPVTRLYERSPAMHDVLREMSDLGFELTGAFPVHRFADQLRVVEFNMTFVNVKALKWKVGVLPHRLG